MRSFLHRSGVNMSRRPSFQTTGSGIPTIPYIMVEDDRGQVGLVTRSDACKSRSKVVIPDFEELEEAIRQTAKRPVEIAIIESPRVTEPITARLRGFGLRTLSDYAGAPVEVVGTGAHKAAQGVDLEPILEALHSGSRGRQLQKRVAKLDLDTPQSALRSNWRERLADVQKIQTADSVTAIYSAGRARFPIPVAAKLDKESSTLWIRSDSDLRTAFFDVIADHVFEQPKKYYGTVLDQAYRIEMKERYPLDYSDGEQSQENIEIDEPISQNTEDSTLSATSAIHAISKPDPSKNVPKPGPIPRGAGSIRRVDKARHEKGRTQSVIENAQIDDLKENQYAWHCQACIAGTDPLTLAPVASYVEVSENRRPMMHAHHCDHVSASGARHVGNIHSSSPENTLTIGRLRQTKKRTRQPLQWSQSMVEGSTP